VAFLGSRGHRPPQLYLHRLREDPTEALALFCPNPWLGSRSLAATEVIRYPSFDGHSIEAVLTLPPDHQEGESYPLVVLPHGGPDGMSLDDFGLFAQIFAQEGMVVFEPNFRGGIGYGSEFYAANRGRIGDIDFRDIMAGVDHLCRNGVADPGRLLVGGWSFGGTMTSWIIGHSDRFRAAVTVAGASDYLSRYGTSDINWGEAARWEFKDIPMHDLDRFVRASPIAHLAGCTTPTLIMHGERDARVPVGQAWELYRALRDVGVEVELVLYPDAGHGISAPKQFADVMDRWLDWYQSHLSR
jgi:dipeptidyl aminopeptidase/acylaminoacyl peptidase